LAGRTDKFNCSADSKDSRSIGVFLLLLVAVGAIVLAAYWPVLSCNALSFDDEQYLLENQLVQNPGWKSAERFLTEVLYPSTVRGYYQPLPMISLMLDYAAAGTVNNLMPFRCTSLFLHIANSLLIIVFLYFLFGRIWPAAAAGLIFGVHPLTVESIPWLAEQKTLLAAFFALWCLIFYVCFSRNKNRKNYVLCMAFFILALMSKPTTTPLPLLMLLLDYWPLNRLSKKTIIEKIPFLAVSVLAAIITFLSQRNTAEVTMPSDYGPWQIPLIICHNIIFYLRNFVWPVRLSAFYPFPSPFTLSNTPVLAGVVGTFVLIIILLVSLRWTRAFAAGWLFFFLAVLPTLGIIGFHPVIAADRHVYLPMVGFLLPLTWLLGRFYTASADTLRNRHILILAVVVILTAAEVTATRRYLFTWRDTVTHYKYMLSLSPNAHILHSNLALTLGKLNRIDEAIEHYEKALQLKSDSHEAHNNLGNALMKKGQIDEAVKHYEKAIELGKNLKIKRALPPGFADAHYNLANALTKQGRLREAIEHYSQALEIEPDNIDTLSNLGFALAQQGSLDKAVQYYNRTLKLRPDNVITHGRLGLALAGLGKTDEAINQFQIVLKERPNDAEMYCNLGILLQQQGKIDQAIESYKKALQINPNFQKARDFLNSLTPTQPQN
jgi:protein O-mannosyl-transferase